MKFVYQVCLGTIFLSAGSTSPLNPKIEIHHLTPKKGEIWRPAAHDEKNKPRISPRPRANNA